ncbi:hypothetical protein [Mesorhizobium sp. ZC-5]|uniref:hypothetical protein n=1 Tax=Mesorhizobium sp. ZC-5 TaxID=2986066 RepID=UPI0021E92BE8|nr:hypothetical protein [Mesorhizobium sp. ZC-5]MCV3242845.1 hypothetical protein [Mesorhizobium sp. ZC-5]
MGILSAAGALGSHTPSYAHWHSIDRSARHLIREREILKVLPRAVIYQKKPGGEYLFKIVLRGTDHYLCGRVNFWPIIKLQRRPPVKNHLTPDIFVFDYRSFLIRVAVAAALVVIVYSTFFGGAW